MSDQSQNDEPQRWSVSYVIEDDPPKLPKKENILSTKLLPQSQSEAVLASKEQAFSLDNAETIPTHIFRYINHLYIKQQQQAETTVTTPTTKSNNKSLFDVVRTITGKQMGQNSPADSSGWGKLKGSSAWNELKKKQVDEQRKKEADELLAQEEALRKRKLQQQLENNLRRQARKYLKKLYMNNLTVKKRNEEDDCQSQSSEEDQMKQLPDVSKIQQTHTSSQYFSNSIQEVKQELTDSDFDPDEFVNVINHVSSKIVGQIENLKLNVLKPKNNHNAQFEMIRKNVNFFERQQAYQNYKENKVHKARNEISQKEKAEHSFTPNLSKSTRLVNQYYNKKLQQRNNHLLKTVSRQSQTECESYIKENIQKQRVMESKQRKSRKTNYGSHQSINNSTYQKQSGGSFQIVQAHVGVQTEWKDNSQEKSKIYQDDISNSSSFYVPIQERVGYILECRQQKLDEQRQLVSQQEEDEIAQLRFFPEINESSMSQRCVDENMAQQFSDYQISWRRVIDDRILEQRIQQMEQRDFPHQPTILQKSRDLAETKIDRQLDFPERMQEKLIKSEIKIQTKRDSQFQFQPSVSQNSMLILARLPPSDNFNRGSYTEHRMQVKREQRSSKILKILHSSTEI